jgi:nucleoside phosphorylase
MATSSIVAQHRKATGVDMESYGLYSAASLAGSQEPKFAVVKAVSDLADSDKSDEFQDYCAYLSAGAIHKFVSRFGVELCSR